MRMVAGRSLAVALIGAGAILALIQFASGRSLWLDEAYLALNILHRTHAQLLSPLDMKQVAPILFLQIERTISPLFGGNELGLRLFPLLCYLVSLFLFLRVLRSLFSDPYTVAFALMVFVFNGTLLYYSSEVKQYMSDVMVYLALLYATIRDVPNERGRYRLLGLLGTIAIFLSNVSPIILLAIGAYLLYRIRSGQGKFAPFAMYAAVPWAITFVLYHAFFIKDHPARQGMIEEWTYYGAFLPLRPFSKAFYTFLAERYRMVAFSLFDLGLFGGVALSVLALLGGIRLVRRRQYGMLSLLVLPLLLHLLLSGFQLYPFATRLILYTVPSIILMAAYGADALLVRVRMVLDRAGSWLLLLPALLLVLFIRRSDFPFKKLEIKESIGYIQRHIRPADHVFVNYHSRVAFQYYQETRGWLATGTDVMIGVRTVFWNGAEWAADTVRFAHQLEGLEGRTWFLFTSTGDERDKRTFLQAYMHRMGKRPLAELHPPGSDVYLYDLGERAVKAR